MVEKVPDWMLLQAGADPGADVAGDAYLQRCLFLRQHLHQFRIARHRKTVPDTFGPDIQRCPYGFGAFGFAGVNSKAKAFTGSSAIKVLEYFRGSLALDSSQANAGHIAMIETGGKIKDLFRSFHAEMPHCIKNPEQ